MRKIAIAAGLGLVLFGLSPASAEDDVTTLTGAVTWADAQNGYLWSSQCRLAAFAQGSAAGGNASYTGAISGTAVAYRPDPNQLATVDLDCHIRVDGDIAVPGGDGPSNGVDSDGRQVTFTATETQTVEVCIGLPGITPHTRCAATNRATAPPGATQSLIDDTLRIVNDALCPLLKSAAPIVVSTVFALEPDGDVVVLGQRVYDCPPFGS